MGERNQNGVDGAIVLLRALANAPGPVTSAALAAAAGLPRSSFHRIARALAEAGLVTLSRGKVAPGPLAQKLVEVRSNALSREREPFAVYRMAPPPSSEPIALTAPLRRRSSRRLRIGFANASMDNPWRVALVHSIEHAVASLGDSMGRLTIRHANDDGKQQALDIDALVAGGVDGLIISATEPQRIAEPLARARAAGIPVVLVDRGVPASVPYHSFVTTDDHVIGRTTALWLAETIGGEGAILMLPGRADAEPALRRLDAAREVFIGFPGIEVLGIEWTEWRREMARAIVGKAIAKHGTRIAGVWCDSGLQGVGSLEAFVAAGRRAGEIPPHTGGDLNLAYKLAIRHRVPVAAVDFPPAMGTAAVEVLCAALRGRWVPRAVNVASAVILSRGHTTRSVKPTLWAEDHVRWDLPDDLVLASGLGPAYNPRRFRIHYPGNRYNRSAAEPMGGSP